MKNVVLKRFFHRERWRIGLYFDYDAKLNSLVRTIPGTAYSGTYKCWYTDDSEQVLDRIRAVIGDLAEIDIKGQVSGEEEVKASVPGKCEISGDKLVVQERKEDEEAEEITDEDLIQVNGIIKNSKGSGEYDPVEIRLNETDGTIAIRFLGRYDRDWIDEISSYRKYRFDRESKEFYLPWSPVTVDSISDYFSSCGIEVNVIKTKVSEVLTAIRKEAGDEIRSRVLGAKSVEALERMKRHLEGVRYSGRTKGSYLPMLEFFFKYYNNKDPQDISGTEISDFVSDFIIRNGYSTSYQNMMVSAIKAYYKITGRRNFDWRVLERPRRSRALPKVFSKDEVKKILSSTRNEKHKLILWMIYACGLRRSEVTNILLTDLDRKRNILHIRQGKGRVDRIVPLSDKLWEKIDNYVNGYVPGKYLFEGQSGEKYSSESVYRVFRLALKNSGIKKEVGVHSLRHSYATHLHESGLDIRYIQELLGHKSTRTTEIYTHVSRRNLSSIRSPIEDLDIN
jgi:integrase/recombinase XerD